MKSHDEKIKIGRKYVHGLRTIVDRKLNDTKWNQDDDVHFGTALMCKRMLIHTLSIERLGAHLDVDLVVRSIFEGIVELFYLYRRPEERFSQWRSYALVRDIILAMKNCKVKEANEIFQKLKSRGHDKVFLTEKGLKAYSAGEALKVNSFHSSWRRKKFHNTVVDLNECIEESPRDKEDKEILLKMKNLLYSRTSEWAHWEIAGMANMISVSGTIYFSDEEAIKRVGAGLLASMHGLSHMAEFADETFRWSIKKIIEDKRNNFIDCFSDHKQQL